MILKSIQTNLKSDKNLISFRIISCSKLCHFIYRATFTLYDLKEFQLHLINSGLDLCLPIAFVRDVRSKSRQPAQRLGATWTTCPSVTQVNTRRDCRRCDVTAWDVSTAWVTWEFLQSNDRKIMTRDFKLLVHQFHIKNWITLAWNTILCNKSDLLAKTNNHFEIGKEMKEILFEMFLIRYRNYYGKQNSDIPASIEVHSWEFLRNDWKIMTRDFKLLVHQFHVKNWIKYYTINGIY